MLNENLAMVPMAVAITGLVALNVKALVWRLALPSRARHRGVWS